MNHATDSRPARRRASVRRVPALPIAVAVLAISAAAAGAQPNVVKLASLVPEGSVWHKILQGTGAVWAGDDRMVQLWKASGFQPVALAATDILIGLQTNMIEAYPTTPLAALTLQWYHSTPFMVGNGLAPLVGGLVITKQAWMKISEPDRNAILAACKKAEDQLTREIPAQDSIAVVEMQKRGLTVTTVKDEGKAEWESTAQGFAAKMRGTMV